MHHGFSHQHIHLNPIKLLLRKTNSKAMVIKLMNTNFTIFTMFSSIFHCNFAFITESFSRYGFFFFFFFCNVFFFIFKLKRIQFIIFFYKLTLVQRFFILLKRRYHNWCQIILWFSCLSCPRNAQTMFDIC